MALLGADIIPFTRCESVDIISIVTMTMTFKYKQTNRKTKLQQYRKKKKKKKKTERTQQGVIKDGVHHITGIHTLTKTQQRPLSRTTITDAHKDYDAHTCDKNKVAVTVTVVVIKPAGLSLIRY